MPLKIYAITVDPNSVSSIQTEDGEILTTAGEEETTAITLQELFDSVVEAITPSISDESKLTVEVTGSVSIKGQGNVRFGFFNIGADTGSTTSMKVVLSTTLKPEDS